MPPAIGKLALAQNSSLLRSEEDERELREKRFKKLSTCAKKMSATSILTLFRREYLDALLLYEKPKDVCKILQKCVEAFERISKMEQTLDKMHFTELLRTGGIGMLSGTDKQGNNILWMQSPPGMKAYKMGSPATQAYIRAAIYTIQVAVIKISPKHRLTIMYDDMSRTLLSFNFKIARELASIAFAAFPLASETVYYFAPKSTRIAWSGICGLLSQRDKSASATIMTSKAKATNIVSDPSEIPSNWMGNTDNGVAYVPNWDNLWNFERCLAKGNETITVSEVFNGDIWCRRCEKVTQGTSALIQPLRSSLNKRENGGKTIVDEKYFDDMPSDAPARMMFVKRKNIVSNRFSSFRSDDFGLKTINENDEDDIAKRRSSSTTTRFF